MLIVSEIVNVSYTFQYFVPMGLHNLCIIRLSSVSADERDAWTFMIKDYVIFRYLTDSLKFFSG